MEMIMPIYWCTYASCMMLLWFKFGSVHKRTWFNYLIGTIAIVPGIIFLCGFKLYKAIR